MYRSPSGWLCINKKVGVTSHSVCSLVRNILREKRVGHAGTLDPLATGVLVVGVSREATRFMEHVTASKKIYKGTVKLGVETDSYDADGAVVAECESPTGSWVPSEGEDATAFREKVQSYLAEKYTGNIEQMPPLVSAIKIGGKKLYEYARKGLPVQVPKRSVTIHSIACTQLLPPDSLELELTCSPGTYVRSIAQDLGKDLTGTCGGHLTALQRTAVGDFHIDNAIELDTFMEMPKEERKEALMKALMPVDAAVMHLPSFTFANAEQTACYRKTRCVSIDMRDPLAKSLKQRLHVRLYDHWDEFVGVAHVGRRGEEFTVGALDVAGLARPNPSESDSRRRRPRKEVRSDYGRVAGSDYRGDPDQERRHRSVRGYGARRDVGVGETGYSQRFSDSYDEKPRRGGRRRDSDWGETARKTVEEESIVERKPIGRWNLAPK